MVREIGDFQKTRSFEGLYKRNKTGTARVWNLGAFGCMHHHKPRDRTAHMEGQTVVECTRTGKLLKWVSRKAWRQFTGPCRDYQLYVLELE
jgi:hypothetical protein